MSRLYVTDASHDRVLIRVKQGPVETLPRETVARVAVEYDPTRDAIRVSIRDEADGREVVLERRLP